MPLITHTEALESLCDRLSKERFVTVDTEFIRERTFWPQLCLVQVAGTQDVAAIDVLAEGIDLNPLYDLMADKNVLKVFHSGKQDIEIFHYLTEEIPTPLYDTQVAAMVLGLGEQAGYETLVREVLGKDLDKSQRFSDWAERPLTPEQLDYALGDVTHLRELYEKLAGEVAAKQRESWVEEELRRLADPDTYVLHPEDAWHRFSKRERRPHYLARLKALAAWRETMAREKDRPRGWIVPDDAVQDIALRNPKTLADLEKLRSRHKQLSPAFLDAIFETIQAANALPVEECPRLSGRATPPPELEPSRDLLKALLKSVCRRHRVTPSLVATTEDLDLFLVGERGVPFLSGWRHAIFGEKAEALLKGNLGLALDPRTRGLELFSYEEES